ncbi:hypothetical protein VCR31J2_1290011 [Vibrio coralliirubri]|uniref:Uncharacterized protein n=1 Tax=Vibrio coralliirubri TaxID=1516159 RepID=A0AA86XB23_9VIBR|nr:hypothetical protein VCR31J2_1290011 [Vibrio coralliirubri]
MLISKKRKKITVHKVEATVKARATAKTIASIFVKFKIIQTEWPRNVAVFVSKIHTSNNELIQ